MYTKLRDSHAIGDRSSISQAQWAQFMYIHTCTYSFIAIRTSTKIIIIIVASGVDLTTVVAVVWSWKYHINACRHFGDSVWNRVRLNIGKFYLVFVAWMAITFVCVILVLVIFTCSIAKSPKFDVSPIFLHYISCTTRTRLAVDNKSCKHIISCKTERVWQGHNNNFVSNKQLQIPCVEV